MKIEVEREVRLSAFELERGDLELLWQRMIALFDGEASLRASISLSLPNQRLTFESFQELRDYPSLRGEVTRFSLEIRQNSRSVEVSSGGLFNSTPIFKVKGDSEVWCAGAIESVIPLIRERRVWYFWLAHFPFMPAFFLMGSMPWIKLGPFSSYPNMSLNVLLSWLALTSLLGYFGFFKTRLLPLATIAFTKEIGFIRKYGSELGLALGVVSLILSIYMWMVPFK